MLTMISYFFLNNLFLTRSDDTDLIFNSVESPWLRTTIATVAVVGVATVAII